MTRAGVALCFCLVGAAGLEGQDPNLAQEIQQSQRRLEQIREERAQLERQVALPTRFSCDSWTA
jgi:cell division protein FtsB